VRDAPRFLRTRGMVLVPQKNQPRTNHVRGDTVVIFFLSWQRKSVTPGTGHVRELLFYLPSKCDGNDNTLSTQAAYSPAHTKKRFCLLGGTVLCTWTCTALLTNPTPHSTQSYFRPARAKDKVSFWSGLAWRLFIVAGHPLHTPNPIPLTTRRLANI
jgi:hypothetical protein